MTRRRFLAATAVGFVGAGAEAFAFEPDRVEITRHTLDEGAPGAPERVSFVQLTDLHLQGIGQHEERIVEAVQQVTPDFIVITGDAIDRHNKLPVLDTFLTLLRPAAAFAILGNWEHWSRVDLPALERLYARHGVELLVNRTSAYECSGGRMLITGLDDLVSARPDLCRALRDVTLTRQHLILAHCPAHRDRLEAEIATATRGREDSAVDFAQFAPLAVLSGHTHGGQLYLAGWAPFRPRGSGRYVRGWYRDGPMPMYVSRGLGTSVVHARFGSVPEVASFEMSLSRPAEPRRQPADRVS
jgi:predicted MPP superfamily phosphohydrolase